MWATELFFNVTPIVNQHIILSVLMHHALTESTINRFVSVCASCTHWEYSKLFCHCFYIMHTLWANKFIFTFILFSAFSFKKIVLWFRSYMNLTLQTHVVSWYKRRTNSLVQQDQQSPGQHSYLAFRCFAPNS